MGLLDTASVPETHLGPRALCQLCSRIVTQITQGCFRAFCWEEEHPADPVCSATEASRLVDGNFL